MLWKRYISETVPKETDLQHDSQHDSQHNLQHNLRHEFYMAMRYIEDMVRFDVYNEAVSCFARKGYTYVFEEYFEPRYLSERKRIDLFVSACEHGHLRILKRVCDTTKDLLIGDVGERVFSNAISTATRNGWTDVLQWLNEKSTERAVYNDTFIMETILDISQYN